MKPPLRCVECNGRVQNRNYALNKGLCSNCRQNPSITTIKNSLNHDTRRSAIIRRKMIKQKLREEEFERLRKENLENND